MASQSQSETNSVIQSQRVRFIDLQEALRSGMAVQMVKTKPRGWVGDARRRHHRKHVTWNIDVVRYPECPQTIPHLT